jgi:cardiolipin synthase
VKKLGSQVLTIPNALTAIRIAATPLIGWWVITEQYVLAFSGFAIAGASDWLDGFIARRFNMQSALGVVLDPVADKILVTTLIAALTHQALIPLPLALLIVGRDVGLILGGFYIRYRLVGVPPWPPHSARFFDTSDTKGVTKPTMTSKLNTAGTFGLLGLSMLDCAYHVVDPSVLTGLMLGVGATTVVSGVQYALMAQRFRKRGI